MNAPTSAPYFEPAPPKHHHEQQGQRVVEGQGIAVGAAEHDRLHVAADGTAESRRDRRDRRDELGAIRGHPPGVAQ